MRALSFQDPPRNPFAHWLIAAQTAWVLVILLSVPCLADEVLLRNGDRLTGTIVTMEEGVLTLATPHSGIVHIKWPEIQGLSADQPLKIQLHDTVEGDDWREWLYTHYAMTESLRISATGPLSFSAIKAINPPPPIRYRGILNIGGNRTQGNTDTQALNASTRWTVRSDRHRILAEGKYNYGEVSTEVNVRNAQAALKYDFFLTTKVFVNTEGLLEKDTFQSLALRTTLGSGLGYHNSWKPAGPRCQSSVALPM